MIRNAAAIASSSGGDRKTGLLVSLVFYVILGVIFLLVLPIFTLGYTFKKYCCDKEDCKTGTLRCVSIVLLTIGNILNYYGGNINDYITDNEDCNDECVRNNKIARSISLGISTLLFFITPEILQRFPEMGYESFTRWHHIILDVSAVIIQLNSLYASIDVMIDQTCSQSVRSLSTASLILTFFVGGLYFIFYAIYTWGTMDGPCDADDDNCEECTHLSRIITIAVLAMLSSIFYVLEDNTQPLSCEYGCDGTNNMDNMMLNATMNDNITQCNIHGLSGAKLGLSLSSLLLFALVCVLAPYTQYRSVKNLKID